MKIQLSLLLIMLISIQLIGQDLPIGKYYKNNPKCPHSLDKYLEIGVEGSFIYSYRIDWGVCRPRGTYTYQNGEFIFNIPKKDLSRNTTKIESVYEIQENSNLEGDDWMIHTEDHSNNILFGVHIQMYNDANEVVKSTVTDTDGQAFFKEKSGEVQYIELSYTGYKTLRIPMEKISSNKLFVKLGEWVEFIPAPPRSSCFIGGRQFTATKSKDGLLVKWSGHDQLFEYKHIDNWKGDCNQK